jgi:imidazolonepropionase-like amidohydrolase
MNNAQVNMSASSVIPTGGRQALNVISTGGRQVEVERSRRAEAVRESRSLDSLRSLGMTALVLSLAMFVVGATVAQEQPVSTAIVIDGGTVHPISGAPFVGRVVVENGRISAVGADAVAPDGATMIDATGQHVYPGMIDALTQVGLIEVNAVPATDDQAEMGTYNSHLSALTALHPASEVIPVTRSNGITHAVVAPQTDGDGVVAGQAALVNFDGWTVEEMAIDPSIAMVVSWPAIRTRRFDFSTFSMVETPFNEAKDKAEEQVNELRDWLEAARHYQQAMAAGSSRLDPDLRLAALAECLDGGKRLIVLASNKRDIEAAVEFAEEENLDIILGGGRDAWKVKEMLAEKGIPVILGLTQSMPAEEDHPYDRPFRNAGDLANAGVKIAFASGAGGGFGPGGPHGSRTTVYEAAMAGAYGLSRDDAYRAMTIWPAEILGVDDHLGTIEVGKIANLMITDGEPLEITSNVQRLIIAGRDVSLDNKHLSLYEKYRARPQDEPEVATGEAPKG